ncbi:MAG: hypothetical protein U0556_09180 [Dehalococcoidia bacterium]
MLVLNRTLRRVVPPFPLALDSAIVAGGIGLTAIVALGALDGAGRDGFAAIQRFGLPAACLVLWVALFRLQPESPTTNVDDRAWWPAAAGFALAAAAGAFIAAQSSGQPWGLLAIAAASYLALFGAAVLRRQPGSGGVAAIVGIELISAAVAFALIPSAFAAAAAATASLVLIAALMLLRRLRTAGPLDELAGILTQLRTMLPLLAAAAATGVLLSLVIGGQTAAFARLIVPLAGLAASRLVAEEIFLRVWLLPGMERRFGGLSALLISAALSGAIAAVIRPGGVSPLAAAAGGIAAGLAAGVLARRTRNAPAVVVFRLIAG